MKDYIEAFYNWLRPPIIFRVIYEIEKFLERR